MPSNRTFRFNIFPAATMLLLWTGLHSQTLGQGVDAVTDFSLIDVNASSASQGSFISPRDYLEQVSGWYFSHTT
jgi:hypothetical protein